MIVRTNHFHYLLCLVLVFHCFGCDDDTSLDSTIDNASNVKGWISNLGLERNSGELSINQSNDYLIVGSDYIMEVDDEGNVMQTIQQPFNPPSTGLSSRYKIFNDKVYRFTSIGFSNEDSEKKIELEIYDKNGNLENSLVLDAKYTLIDIIIEEDKMTLLTWDWNDPDASGARTQIFQVDTNGQLLFQDRLTSFPNIRGRVFDLINLEDGNFLFEYDKTLYKVTNEFEPISSFATMNTVHHFTEGPNGNIYVGGIISGIENYLIKLDGDLNKLNEITFNNELVAPIHPSLTNYAFGGLAIVGNNLYTLEVAYEYGQELRLQCFDLDFNKNNEFILEGSGPLSDLMINELGSVSFLYGNPFGPFEEFPDLTPTEVRLFKLDADCQLPEETITN